MEPKAGTALCWLATHLLFIMVPQVVRWMVMQAGNLPDKSVLGEGPSPEAIATGLAVGLTL